MEFLQAVGDFLQTSISLGEETLPFTWGGLLLKFVLPVAAYIVFYKLVMLLVRRIFRKSKLQEETKTKIRVWIRRVLLILLVILIGILVGILFGAKIFRYIRLAFGFLTQPFFESGNTQISIITILLAVPIFFIASWLSKLVRGILDRGVLSRLGIDNAKQYTVSNLLRYIVFLILILIGLSIIGINLSSLAVIFGVLGIGLGFGLQKVIANLFAGFVIVLTRPIKEGDRIFVLDNETEGNVVRVKALATVINTVKNETIIVPNSLLTEDMVYNYSYDDDPSILLENIVDIAYTADLEKALEILTDVGKRNPHALPGKDPIPRVSSFENSGIRLRLFTWIRDANEKWPALSWANLEIWREFKKHKVEIPFPQVDVHFRNAIPGSGPDLRKK
jgi:small-conductance mechanosensitive channel